MYPGGWQYQELWGRGRKLYGDLRWAAGKPYAMEEGENTWKVVMVASAGTGRSPEVWGAPSQHSRGSLQEGAVKEGQ